MTRQAKRLGRGSVCSVLIKNLHPKNIIAAAFPNATAQDRLDDLVAFKKDSARRQGGRVTKNAIYFLTPSIPNEEVWAAMGFTRVIQECPEENAFTRDTAEESTVPAVQEAGIELPEEVLLRTGDLDEDISRVLELGLQVDDDREPAPENIPTTTTNERDPITSLYLGQSWGWDGNCQRTLTTPTKQKAGFHQNWSPLGKTYFELFEKYIPLSFFEDVCVKRTSANLEAAGEVPTNLGEMLCYLGLKLLMATMVGFSQRQYFSSQEFHERTNPCPLKLSTYMPRRRMELIDHHISITDRQAPSYTDRFWEVRQLLDEWQRNMKEIFYPSWALCLDESMSIWMNRYTCPGWVFCPRKPHPFGNEYHTICCAETGILFDFEIVEGNDRPREMPAAEFADKGKTAGLLLRLTKSVHHSARYVVLDSGFCVLKALVELQKVGVFAGALIKKRRFWPALVPGDVMIAILTRRRSVR